MRTRQTVLASLATLSLAGSALAQTLSPTPLFSLSPGDRTYLQNDNNTRGIAYNASSTHLLLVSRTGALGVNVLDGTTGSDIGTLNVTGITGGTFALNLIRVGSDGAIYGANLTTDASTSPYKIYRWANEAAVPVVIYSGDPSGGDPTATNRRFGDSLDIRGGGTGVQILAASRSGTIVSLITTGDGTTFTATPRATDAAAGDLGLGVTFGAGNTFWGTATGRPLRQLDLISGNTLNLYTSTVFPTSIVDIDVDAAQGYLVGINLNTTPTRDTLELYNISLLSTGSTNTPTDLRSFPVDNVNANGTGAVDFGNNVVYALDSNNGLVAYGIVPEPGTLALSIIGGLALGWHAIRRRR